MTDIYRELIDLKGNGWSMGLNMNTPFQKTFSDQCDKNISNIMGAIPKWISVDARLPTKGESNLFCACVDTGCHEPFTGDWTGDWANAVMIVIDAGDEDDLQLANYWMPLPEPPNNSDKVAEDDLLESIDRGIERFKDPVYAKKVMDAILTNPDKGKEQ